MVLEQDVMLHFPYHSFNPVIDMLREAAIDPDVTSIKITCYRLAQQSKIINALINAVRNGKQVTVMLELRARFEEEANLEWKEQAGRRRRQSADRDSQYESACQDMRDQEKRMDKQYHVIMDL